MPHRCHPRHSEHFSREEFARSLGTGRGRGRGRGGPRARRGDVRAAVLVLLAERPMHGYEMIKELEQRTAGAWTPSAGSIYPTLQMLEEADLIRGEEADGKRRFSLTDQGRAEQESRASEQTPWEAARAGADPEAVQLRDAVVKLNHSFGQVFHAGDEDQRRRVRELLDETRRKVYAILAEAS